MGSIEYDYANDPIKTTKFSEGKVLLPIIQVFFGWAQTNLQRQYNKFFHTKGALPHKPMA
jgi:hypothetical protein